MRILMVEDNPDDAFLVREYLEDVPAFACELTHVDDLGSGLARCGQDKFDVILLDLSLPDAWGLDTVRRMHAANTHVPIVVLTGLDDEQVRLEAVREGAQDYLVKRDLGGRVLVRALRDALERQRAQEELRQTE